MNYIKRSEVSNVVKKFVGTRYKPQGRLVGVGLDCLGTVIELMKELKIYKGGDKSNYSQIPDGYELYNSCKEWLVEKNIEEMQEGDVLLMKFNEEPQHLAVLVDNNNIVHSYLIARKVVIHRLDDLWKSRVIAVFEFKEIEK